MKERKQIQFQLPVINIDSDEYDWAIESLMWKHGMPRAGAKAYLIKLMKNEAEQYVGSLVFQLNIGHFKKTI